MSISPTEGQSGMFPLHEACRRTDAILPFIGNGQGVNVQDDEGNTPLHYAALGLNTPAIQILFQNGARTDLQNKYGETALHLLFGRIFPTPVTEVTEALKVFIQHRAYLNFTDSRGQTPLQLACQYTGLNAVKMLVMAGAEIHTRNIARQTPLYTANLWNFPDVAAFLMLQGVSENILNSSQESI